MKKLILIALFGFLLTGCNQIAGPGTNNPDLVSDPVTSFEECVAEGNPVMESYPRQCQSKAGNLFVEVLPESSTIPDQSLTPEPINPGDDQIACTMDAKECPDGSFVGRIPPSCEFAACPGENESR